MRHRSPGRARTVLALALLVQCWPGGCPLLPSQTLDTLTVGAYDGEVSPDGMTVAFGLLGDIWLVGAEGGIAERLTSGMSWDHDPSWSPDGSALVFVRDDPASTQLVLRTLSTQTDRVLHARGPLFNTGWGAVFTFGSPRFHPSDGRLYFIDFRAGIQSIAWRNASRQVPRELLSGAGSRPGRPGIAEHSTFAFSPDGSRLAVTRDTTDMWSVVTIGALPDPALALVTPAEPRLRSSVRWTPDGASLVYIEREGGTEYATVQPLQAGGPSRHRLGPATGTRLSLHGTGQRALLTRDRRLEWIDLATGARTPLTIRAILPRRPPQLGDLVIEHARLFSGLADTTISDASIVVLSGRIAQVVVGPVAGLRHVARLDASGRFVMAGLTDSHAHISAENDRYSMARTLASGITRLIDPGSPLSPTLNLRDAIARGVLAGPRIHTSGPVLDGPKGRARPFIVANLQEPEEARALVRALAGAGVDLIKTYAFLEPAVVAAVIEEAHAAGLPVIGDFVETTWQEAVNAGVDGVVHLMDHKWRFLARPPLEEVTDPWSVVEPDSALSETFFTRLARSRRMIDPTVLASTGLFGTGDIANVVNGAAPDSVARRRVRVVGQLLRSLHRAGVQWVAGTDANPSNLVDELAAYEALGIPRAEILRSATIYPAHWLQRDDFGAIAPGQQADLLLLDGDPLTRIDALREVAGVVVGGRVLMAPQ